MIANITIYPSQGALHSSSKDLSALAGYAKALFRAMPTEIRRRQVVLTNVKKVGPATYDDDGIEVRECWRKGSLLFAWDLWKQFKAHPQWKVIHLQHEFNQFGGVLTLPVMLFLLAGLRFFLSRKIAVTLHEVLPAAVIDQAFLRQVCIPYPAPLVRRFFYLYYRLLGYLTHSLIVLDEYFAGVLAEDYGVRTKVEIVRLGTENADPAPREFSREKLCIPEDSFVLLFFGSLDWRKGVDVLVEAFALLPPGRFFLLLGGGAPKRVSHTVQYQEWWANVMRLMKPLQGIHHLGFVADSDIPLIFGAADLVVFPYLFPQRISAAFNQAASFGVPCIVSEDFASRAHPDMIFAATPRKLAEKILEAADGRLPRLKEEVLAFRAGNSWEVSANAISQIHEKLMAGSR